MPPRTRAPPHVRHEDLLAQPDEHDRLRGHSGHHGLGEQHIEREEGSLEEPDDDYEVEDDDDDDLDAGTIARIFTHSFNHVD